MHLRTTTRALVGGLALATLCAPAAFADDVPTVTTTAPAITTTAPVTSEPTAPAPATETTTATASDPTVTETATASDPTVTETAAATATGTHSPLVLGGTARVFGPAPRAGAVTNPAPEEAAGGYLAAQLAAGGNHLSSFGFPDWGLTADAILALDAAGVAQTQAAASTSELAAHVKDYVTGEAYGDAGSAYAGATAKALNVAVAQGVDPHAFGGVDLVATLKSLETASGRFSDVSTYGDYSNTIGQSFALIGLKRAGVNPSPAAVALLGAQQCADGGFRLYLGAEPCASDPDATSFAVQALIAVNGSGDAAAARGLDFLAGQQQPNGALGGGFPQTAVNANSTGLAGQAFLAGGRTAQSRLADGYLASLQYDCDFAAVLRGGIAYDKDAYDKQAKAGAGATTSDQDLRSTAQAILALAGTPLYAVTATGATAGTPTMTCTVPTTSTTTSTTTQPTTTKPTTTHSTGTTGTSGSTTSAASPTASATDGDALAYTGSEALPIGLLALGLLAGGSALVLVARRRGTHA